jgi:hypothetical protein
MVMLTLAEKRVSQRQQKMRRYKRERTTKPNRSRHKCQTHQKYVQVPEKELTPAIPSRNLFKQNERELPEMIRQVEKENGISRSSRDDASGSGKTTEVEPAERKENAEEVHLQQVAAEQQAAPWRSERTRGRTSRRKRDFDTSAGRTSTGRTTTPKEKKKLN